MQAHELWRTVTMDHADLLGRLLGALEACGARFCVIGGTGVNAYATPLISLDLDLVIALADRDAVEAALRQQFTVEPAAHGATVLAADSKLRVLLHADARCAAFLDRATSRPVLGVPLPVASVDDLLLSAVWAFEDAARSASRRQRALTDIARLLEVRPDLRDRVPEPIRLRLV
jgi:hypothetical protein